MRWRELTSRASTPALAEVALAVVASAAGALAYHGFFTSEDYLPTLVFACLVGGVTAALGSRRAWSTALAAVAGPVLVIVLGVFRGASSAVLPGVRGSWNRLLTTAVPADPSGELLVVPALVMWAAAFSAVLLVRRTRNVPAPLAPPLAGFVFAVFAVGDQTGNHATATVVFLTAALALIAVRAHRSTGSGIDLRGRQSSRAIVALPLVALTIACSALFGVVGGQLSRLASGEHRFDIRDVLAPPAARFDTITPLAQLKKQLNENPPRTLFTVRLDGASAGKVDRMRTAALDDFDGTTWNSTGTYRTAGDHLSSDFYQPVGDFVTAHVELKELPGPYLPVVGRPTTLSAPGKARDRFGFDLRSGVVIGIGSAERGFSYDVTGQISERDEDALSRSGVEEDRRPLLADPPQALRTFGSQFQGGPFDLLVALESRLRSVSYRLDRPPGHSYAAIARLLAEGNEGGGFAEQNASAFTAVAKLWGFAARVAVGYRLKNAENGAFHVTTADAHAWSEVLFPGYGWIAFDPTGTGDSSPVTPPEAPRVVPPRPAQADGVPPATTRADGSPTASKPTETSGEQGIGWNQVRKGASVLASATAVLAVLATVLVVLVKARRRRHRRRGPDPAAQVLGAWREQFDRLAERGISPPVSLTCHEVAEHVRGRIGDVAEPVEATAGLVTTAIYAPEHLDQAEADQAWALVARLNKRLYPRRVSAARLRAAVDPRPLWTEWGVARRRRRAGEQLEMGRYR